VRSLGLVLLFCGVAHAASSPTVAVMPFKDLSGGKGAVGEAIRETVTTDLRDVPGMRVIERGNLDKVLSELNLQANKADLDPMSTVKVGKLLGATLIVGGAYQQAGSTVRLTARFVKVETGEIVGTAKVDGASSDLFKLQDRVTAELLKSAGLGDKHVQTFAKRTRPKLKSLKTVELYGDAVVETDEDKKRDLLKLALNEEPTFTYALRDLDALEKRIKQYEKQSIAAQDQEQKELQEKLAKETDPEKRCQLTMQVMTGLMSGRRYRALLAESKKVLAHPGGVSCFGGTMRLDEMAGYNVVLSHNTLKEHDATLREGEAFMKRFPASMYFQGVRSTLDTVIAEKRKREEGKAKVTAELQRMSSDLRWNLCHVAREYRNEHQWKEAQRLYLACLEVGTGERGPALLELMQVEMELPDFAAARKHLNELSKVGGQQAQAAKAYEMMMPIDG
jgi:TolB-like protein